MVSITTVTNNVTVQSHLNKGKMIYHQQTSRVAYVNTPDGVQSNFTYCTQIPNKNLPSSILTREHCKYPLFIQLLTSTHVCMKYVSNQEILLTHVAHKFVRMWHFASQTKSMNHLTCF